MEDQDFKCSERGLIPHPSAFCGAKCSGCGMTELGDKTVSVILFF